MTQSRFTRREFLSLVWLEFCGYPILVIMKEGRSDAAAAVMSPFSAPSQPLGPAYLSLFLLEGISLPKIPRKRCANVSLKAWLWNSANEAGARVRFVGR